MLSLRFQLQTSANNSDKWRWKFSSWNTKKKSYYGLGSFILLPLLERIFVYIIYIILNCVSACNRTYYGEVGYTYRLNVKKSSKDRPFLCHLSFTASGQEHGDFVEVSIMTLYVYIRLKYNEDLNSFEQKNHVLHIILVYLFRLFLLLFDIITRFELFSEISILVIFQDFFSNVLFFWVYLKKWFVWMKNDLMFMKFCHNQFILSPATKKLKFLKR